MGKEVNTSEIKQEIAQGVSKVAQAIWACWCLCILGFPIHWPKARQSRGFEHQNYKIVDTPQSLWMITHQVKAVLATQISFLFPGSIRGIKSSPCWPVSMLMTVVSAGSLKMELVLFFLMNASSHQLHGIAQCHYCHQLHLFSKSLFLLRLPLHPSLNPSHSAQEL